MASAAFNPVLDDEYVWFTLTDEEALSHYWENLLKHISDAERRGREAEHQWLPWDIIFPPWFYLEIPGIGNTLFDGRGCKGRKRDVSEPEPGMDEQDLCMVKTPYFDRCILHEDHESQGNLSLKHWLPCAADPTELQMPVRAMMPLSKVVEAIRNTELNWLHRHLLAFSEKMGVGVETLLERGPQPEDCNIYLEEWPKSLVDELGFVWRKESVTFV